MPRGQTTVKTKPIFLLTSALLVTGLAGWQYYDHYIKAQPREHGVGVMPLSCSETQMKSLELKIDGETLWTKKHDELLTMDGAINSQDRRFKGHHVMPVSELIRNHTSIKTIEVIPCDAESISLTYSEITKIKGEYLLGQNRKGRMKLLRSNGKPNSRYNTVLRNVKAINMKH